MKMDEQVQALKREMKSEPDVNFNMSWLERYGQKTHGDWAKFRNFLAEKYLPDFASTSAKPADERIVLAVVTHSNFMMKGEIKSKCQQTYPIDTNTKRKKA